MLKSEIINGLDDNFLTFGGCVRGNSKGNGPEKFSVLGVKIMVLKASTQEGIWVLGHILSIKCNGHTVSGNTQTFI